MTNYKRLAIGFDETNNGFSLPHEPFLITTGVLGIDGRGYGNVPYGSKHNRKFFGKNLPSEEEVLTASLNYLSRNKDFYYTTIPKKYWTDSTCFNLLRAKAMAAISLRFFKDYSLNKTTPIFVHQVDGLKESFFIEHALTNFLFYAGIEKPEVKVLVNWRKKDLKEVIKKADMTGYYLAALKFILKKQRWPFRKRKIPLKTLDDMVFEERFAF